MECAILCVLRVSRGVEGIQTQTATNTRRHTYYMKHSKTHGLFVEPRAPHGGQSQPRYPLVKSETEASYGRRCQKQHECHE